MFIIELYSLLYYNLFIMTTSEERIIHLYPDKPAEEFSVPDDAKNIQLDPKDLKMLSMMREIVKEEVSGIYSRLDTLEKGQEQLTLKVNTLEKGQEQLTLKVNNLEKGQEQLTLKVNNLEEGQRNLEEGQRNLEEGQSSIITQLQVGFNAMIELHEISKERLENKVLNIFYTIHQSQSHKKQTIQEHQAFIANVEKKMNNINYDELDQQEQEIYTKVRNILGHIES